MATSSSLRLPYITLGGVAIGVIFLSFIVISPLISDINATRGDIRTKQLLLQEKEEYLRIIDRKIAQLKTQGEQEQHLEVVLPTENRMEDTLRILHEYANAAGIAIERVSNKSATLQATASTARARGNEEVIPTGVGVLAFNVEFNATYQQLRMFINTLEKSPRLVDTQSIKIVRNAEDQNVVKATMTIQFYRQEIVK